MTERYTELMDAAQEQQDKNNREALAAVQARVLPESDPDFDGKHCIDGGEPIPKARLALGKIRCVKCQEAVELHDKLNRRKR